MIQITICPREDLLFKVHDKYNQNGSLKKKALLLPLMGTQGKKVPFFYHEVHLALVVRKLFINRLSTWDTSYKQMERHIEL